MDMRARLEEYVQGIGRQIEDITRQLHMAEGALQLANQLLADLDAEAAEQPAEEQGDE